MKVCGTVLFAIFVFMKKDHRKQLVLLMATSLVIRIILAAITELGNDEVYYWTYALFPDWSHFDHPPMLGWIIQLFTCDLMWDSAFALRIPALVMGTVNTWLFYRLGIMIKDERTGWHAALLHTGSLYASVIAGTCILPDTPLGTFYLASLYFMIKACYPGSTTGQPANPINFLWAGIFTGLAVLSKYTGIFLWTGTILYLLIYRRKTFKEPWLWAGMTVTLVLFTPVIIWNLKSDLSSFAFHSERVSFLGEGIKPLFLGKELMGSFLYNNPLNVILIIWSVIGYLKLRRKGDPSLLPVEPATFRLLMFQALPFIATFVFFSLFRETLPHWSAPGYYPLILFCAASVSGGKAGRAIKVSPVVLTVIVAIAVFQVKTGFIPLTHTAAVQNTVKNDSWAELGRKDFTLDMYGWKQLGEHFSRVMQEQEMLYRQRNGEEGMPPQSAILANRWFPAAHLDYYVARPNGIVVKTKGPLERTHKYEQITEKRGGIAPGEPFYYIESSRFPERLRGTVSLDTFVVTRCQKPVIRYVVHRITDVSQFTAE